VWILIVWKVDNSIQTLWRSIRVCMSCTHAGYLILRKVDSKSKLVLNTSSISIKLWHKLCKNDIILSHRRCYYSENRMCLDLSITSTENTLYIKTITTVSLSILAINKTWFNILPILVLVRIHRNRENDTPTGLSVTTRSEATAFSSEWVFCADHLNCGYPLHSY
jgi:hypothetical protein